MLVLAVVAIAAGVIFGILVDNTTVRILLAAIGVAAGATLSVFARKTIMKEDAAKMAAETRRIRDEWRTVAGEARALRGETYRGPRWRVATDGSREGCGVCSACQRRRTGSPGGSASLVNCVHRSLPSRMHRRRQSPLLKNGWGKGVRGLAPTIEKK